MVVVCLSAGCAGSEEVSFESEIASVQEETGNEIVSVQEETEYETENEFETEVATEIVDAQEIMDLALAAMAEQKHVLAEYEYADLSMEDGQPANNYYYQKWAWDTEKQVLCETVKWPDEEEVVAVYCDFENGKLYYPYNHLYAVREMIDADITAYGNEIIGAVYQFRDRFLFQLHDEVVEGYEDCFVISDVGYGGESMVVTTTYYINKDTYLFEKYTKTTIGQYSPDEDLDITEKMEYKYLDESAAEWAWYTEILELPPEEIVIPEEEIY